MNSDYGTYTRYYINCAFKDRNKIPIVQEKMNKLNNLFGYYVKIETQTIIPFSAIIIYLYHPYNVSFTHYRNICEHIKNKIEHMNDFAFFTFKPRFECKFI